MNKIVGFIIKSLVIVFYVLIFSYSLAQPPDRFPDCSQSSKPICCATWTLADGLRWLSDCLEKNEDCDDPWEDCCQDEANNAYITWGNCVMHQFEDQCTDPSKGDLSERQLKGNSSEGLECAYSDLNALMDCINDLVSDLQGQGPPTPPAPCNTPLIFWSLMADALQDIDKYRTGSPLCDIDCFINACKQFANNALAIAEACGCTVPSSFNYPF